MICISTAIAILVTGWCVAVSEQKNLEEKIKKTSAEITEITNLKTSLHNLAQEFRNSGENINDEVFVDILSKKWRDIDTVETTLKNGLSDAKRSLTNLPKLINLGKFKITHYCPCQICNGKFVGQKTAYGTELTPHKTIAVDPKKIALGSVIFIGGKCYTAEDVGGGIKGNEVDICVSSHAEAMKRGVIYADVYIRKGN